jgi:hypothetical protein
VFGFKSFSGTRITSAKIFTNTGNSYADNINISILEKGNRAASEVDYGDRQYSAGSNIIALKRILTNNAEENVENIIRNPYEVGLSKSEKLIALIDIDPNAVRETVGNIAGLIAQGASISEAVNAQANAQVQESLNTYGRIANDPAGTVKDIFLSNNLIDDGRNDIYHGKWIAGNAKQIAAGVNTLLWVGGVGTEVGRVAYEIYNINGYKFVLDDFGRTIKVNATLRLEQGVRDTAAQRIAGGIDRLPTDHGFHLIGTRFNGPEGAINLVAGDSKLNVGLYKQLENSWASTLRTGSSIDVDMNIMYKGNLLRPDKFNISYMTNGINKQNKIFNNTKEGK